MQVSNPTENVKELNAKIQALIFENKDLKTNLSSVKNANHNLEKKAEWLEIELASSKHQCELLKNVVYGKRSERHKESYTEQMSFLFNEAEEYAKLDEPEIEEIKPTSSQKKSNAGRKALPSNLPRVEIIHELKGNDLQCKCGGELTHIGSEESEQLDVIPAKVIVNKHIRYKYACKCCEEVVKRAPSAFTPIEKSIATSSLLAHIYTQKFEDHLPLYRQERIWKRLGISLSRATMSNWILSGSKLLMPIIDLLKKDINNADYVCSDETTLTVLKNEKSTNYMWMHMSGNRENRAIIYEYQQSRSGKCVNNFLKSFKGYHQCDGYPGYNELHNKEGVIGVGCMAHARRKFMDILKVTKQSGIATRIVTIISQLYEIEKKISELPVGEIYQIRQSESKPIMEKLHQTLLHYRDQAPPTSILGKAINYPLNQWPKLIAYLEDGRVRIDNNDSERIIKPFVIGRKNWLFSHSEKGAEASSVIFSIIETCKANNVNSYNYLKYLFENIHKAKNAEELRAILPYNLDTAALIPS